MQKGIIKNLSQELLDEVRSKTGDQNKAISLFRKAYAQGNFSFVTDKSWSSSGWTVLHWAAYKHWNSLINAILYHEDLKKECLRESNPPWFSGYLNFLGLFNGNQTPGHIACLKKNLKPTLTAIKVTAFRDKPKAWAQFYNRTDALGRSIATASGTEELAPVSGPTIYNSVMETYKNEYEEYEAKYDRFADTLEHGKMEEIATQTGAAFAEESGLSSNVANGAAKEATKLLKHHKPFADISQMTITEASTKAVSQKFGIAKDSKDLKDESHESQQKPSTFEAVRQYLPFKFR